MRICFPLSFSSSGRGKGKRGRKSVSPPIVGFSNYNTTGNFIREEGEGGEREGCAKTPSPNRVARFLGAAARKKKRKEESLVGFTALSIVLW